MDHKDWIASAEQDWMTIESIFEAHKGAWGSIAFHAQQAAEKYLKCFLVFKGVRPPKSHDLSSLLKIAQGYDPSLSQFGDECADLADHAIHSRYPSMQDKYDEELALLAVGQAKLICNAIAERI